VLIFLSLMRTKTNLCGKQLTHSADVYFLWQVLAADKIDLAAIVVDDQS
jgi:hypothetical protein